MAITGRDTSSMKKHKSRPPRVCIAVDSIPPLRGGGRLRAYRYAVRLHQHKRLGLLLSLSGACGGVHHGTTTGTSCRGVPDELLQVLEWINPDAKIPRPKKPLAVTAVSKASLVLRTGWSFWKHRSLFDIVHCFGAGSLIGLLTYVPARLLKKKYVVEMTLLGEDDPSSITQNGPWPLGALALRLLSRADAVVSLSPALSTAYIEAGFPQRRLWEIWNSVDSAVFCPPAPEEKLELRRNLGIPEQAFCLLFVGAPNVRKGADLLLPMLTEVLEHVNDVVLLVVGSTTDRQGRKRQFVRDIEQTCCPRVSNKVQLMGFVQNVHEYMKASDVLVHPSRREGMPNAILEAMATGLPVVAARIPGITDVILEDAHTGLLVAADAHELACGVLKLKRDKDMYVHIARAARQRAVERFSCQRVDSEYERMYSEL